MPLKRKRKRPHRQSNHKRELLTTVEYRHFQLLRIINLITMFVFGVILGIAAMFLYNRIYTVIGQAQYILTLERQTISNAIDFQLLDKIEISWEEKYIIDPITISRDPFNMVIPPPPPETASSTEVVTTTIE